MVYKMATRIFKHFGFWPQNQNFDFSKINTYKIKTIEDIPKTGIYSIEVHTNYQCTKLEANIFITVYAMAQKPGKGDDVNFLNRIFGISNTVARQNKWRFF